MKLSIIRATGKDKIGQPFTTVCVCVDVERHGARQAVEEWVWHEQGHDAEYDAEEIKLSDCTPAELKWVAKELDSLIHDLDE